MKIVSAPEWFCKVSQISSGLNACGRSVNSIEKTRFPGKKFSAFSVIACIFANLAMSYAGVF